MQAVLILAHNNPMYVLKLGKKLSEKFEVYVHFDLKYRLSQEERELFMNENIHCYSVIDVKWGSWSIVQATIYLMKQALKNDKIEYMHVISGQDWPVISVEEIYSFYDARDDIFLDCEPAKGIKKTGEDIEKWQKFYFNYDVINRKTTFGKIYHRIIFWGQVLLRVDKLKKLGLDITLYQGSQWADLPRDAVEFLIAQIENNSKFRKLFSTGFCSDEFWMQTILCTNDKYRSRIVSNNHRYIKWEEQYGSYPAILDERDYNDICNSDSHFARKLTFEQSSKLIELLGVN